MVSGANFISKKNKRKRILKIIEENLTKKLAPWVRDPEKIHLGSGSQIQGVKKHRIPNPISGSATRNHTHYFFGFISHF
jgi:hypothetical protein